MNEKQSTNQQLEPGYRSQENILDIGDRALTGAVELGQDMEKDNLNVTEPETRVYSPYEDYQFLVHVPLNGADSRASEIGSERAGVLMTSLVSNMRPATFEGQGGIIVAQPDRITGSTPHDNGDVIRTGTKVAVDELLRPQRNGDYNQVDMTFDATKPVGVMIKRAATDGRELGTEHINRSLKEYALRHDLPIAEVIVLPDENMPEEVSSEVVPSADGTALLTVIIPGSGEYYLKAQVLRGDAYHVAEGEDMAARIMKITAYGETIRELNEDDGAKVTDALAGLLRDGDVSDADIKAINRELA